MITTVFSLVSRGSTCVVAFVVIVVVVAAAVVVLGCLFLFYFIYFYVLLRFNMSFYVESSKVCMKSGT